MAYFVFRISYEESFNSIRDELIRNHLLRQGWGVDGMELSGDFDSFKQAWINAWGNNTDERTIRTKYNNLQIMTQIKQNDIIVIPKISLDTDAVCRSFVVARCKREYGFSLPEGESDFGHYIEVDDMFSCDYDANIFSRTIKSKFNAYRSPLNSVSNEPFILAVEDLIKYRNENSFQYKEKNKDLTGMISAATNTSRRKYLEQIIETINNNLGFHEFEDIIRELFEKNGYILTGRNWYDGKGGDVDLIFECFKQNTLLHNIYTICDIEMPHIYVQAKKKTGTDADDKIGVDQLLQMKEKISETNATLITINLTDDFSQETKDYARECGVILIDGKMFASLLVRYGIEVEII